MSTASAARWRLLGEIPEDARCLFCEDDAGPLVDCALELDGERVFICETCTVGLARTARVGSKAAEALRHEYENEIAERDARVHALTEQLRTAERNLAAQREQSARSQEALDQARVLASQAVGSLQQIGQ